MTRPALNLSHYLGLTTIHKNISNIFRCTHKHWIFHLLSSWQELAHFPPHQMTLYHRHPLALIPLPLQPSPPWSPLAPWAVYGPFERGPGESGVAICRTDASWCAWWLGWWDRDRACGCSPQRQTGICDGNWKSTHLVKIYCYGRFNHISDKLNMVSM